MTALFSRRAFVFAGLTGAGGLLVGVAAGWPLAGDPASPEIRDPGEVNAFVAVEPDGAILLRIPKSEMGQAVTTSLAMIVAEELECDFSRVKVEYASARRNVTEGSPYGSMGTGGSSSVRRGREMLQQAGASARERLIVAAARRWGVEPAACAAREGRIWNDNRSLGYGELAAEAAQALLAAEPAIRTPENFKLIGKPIKRLDAPPKVTGEAKFGIDVRLPDMLYAAVANCPVFGGRAVRWDEGKVLGRRGVVAVVGLSDAVAVVADRFWRAKEAVAALPIEWDFGDAGKTSSEGFRAEYRAALDGKLANAVSRGDLKSAFEGAQTVEALYETPHLAHAPMEPLNATVHWRPDRIDVWMGTQFPEQALRLAAEVGGVSERDVYVHNQFLGGGFGRRAVNDELRQAVLVSKAVNKPVKLIWTREEDIQHDRYRPQAAIRMRAAMRSEGTPAAFDFRTAVGSISRSLGWGKVESGVEPQAVEGLVNVPYRVEALNVDCALKNTHVPVMFWRSVGSSQNAFAVESFIDELAHHGGRDPLEFRRAGLADRPDFLRVLDELARRADWGREMPKGSAQGLAIHECFGTIVGEVVEVRVTDEGEAKVDRVVAVVDCGHVVNPLHAAMQIESGVIYGLTAALFGEITIRDGRVEQSNFDSYPIARLADAPRIETYFALSGGGKWGGIGEPGTPPVGPALANAIFRITGKRIRALPLKNGSLGV